MMNPSPRIASLDRRHLSCSVGMESIVDGWRGFEMRSDLRSSSPCRLSVRRSVKMVWKFPLILLPATPSSLPGLANPTPNMACWGVHPIHSIIPLSCPTEAERKKKKTWLSTSPDLGYTHQGIGERPDALFLRFDLVWSGLVLPPP